MARTLLLYLFCMMCMSSFGRQLPLDSLRMELNKHTARDTVRVNTLNKYAESLPATRSSEAIVLLREGMAIAKENNYPKGIAGSLLVLSAIYADKNRYDSAIAFGLQAMEISEKNKLAVLYAVTQNALGEQYRMMGQDSLSEFHLQNYLRASRELKRPVMILNALVNLSLFYTDYQRRAEGAKYSEEALKLAQELNHEEQLARILEIKTDEAREKKDYKQALVYYHQILPVWIKKDNVRGIAWIQLNMGEMFIYLNNKDSARFYTYKGFNTAYTNELNKELKDAYETLFRYHANFKDYKQALEYRLLYDSMEVEATSTEMTQGAERNRLKFEHEKEMAIASSAQAEKDSATRATRNLQYAVIAVFAILVAFLYWNNRRKQKAKKEIESAYAVLKNTQNQLIQSEKMASLGELTAGIAHEIQNPLNFVNNFSEVSRELIDELKDDNLSANEKQEIINDLDSNLEKINVHGKRADAIVKGMLQHSRSSSGKKELTDINALCDEYLRLSYHGLRAKDKTFNAKFETILDNTLPKIEVIPQEIGRVILNLINNAFYAVNQRKQNNEPGYEPTVIVSTKNLGNNIEVIVRDNGTGIPQQVVDKIFQPFFTTKPTGQGTGLGLSLSYDIITKAHKGTLQVETKEGAGTSFIIQLPNHS